MNVDFERLEVNIQVFPYRVDLSLFLSCSNVRVEYSEVTIYNLQGFCLSDISS